MFVDLLIEVLLDMILLYQHEQMFIYVQTVLFLTQFQSGGDHGNTAKVARYGEKQDKDEALQHQNRRNLYRMDKAIYIFPR